MTVNRKVILDTVDDLAGKFLYYDRKEDEELGVGDIDAAVRCGEISIDEIVACFRERLERGIRK